MSTSSESHVLVFGPTGTVGGATATEALKRGAKVTLAMRDPSKSVSDALKDLPRVKADLTDSASVLQASKETGANVAFVYVTLGQDQSGLFQALKSGGVKHVVMLSSYGVYYSEDLQAALNANFISASHARLEMELHETGLSHSIIRPRYFASNFHMFTPELKERKLLLPPREFCNNDYVVPEDIGAVCGACVFAQSSETIALCGAQMLDDLDAWQLVAKELGIDLRVEHVSLDAWRASKEGKMPPQILDSLFKVIQETTVDVPEPKHFTVGRANIEKYTGKPATTLPEWIRGHRAELAAAAGV